MSDKVWTMAVDKAEIVIAEPSRRDFSNAWRRIHCERVSVKGLREAEP